MGQYILIRTNGERRSNSDPDTAEFVRAKRKGRMLPSAWDDSKHARGGNSKPKHKDHR